MKKVLITILSLGLAGSAWASVEMIAGWENWSGKKTGDASRMNGVTAGYESSSEWSIHSTGASADGSFGNFATEPVAEGVHENLTDGQRLPNGSSGSHTFTVSDTSGTARTLTFFHFDSGSLRKNSSRHWKLEVVSGDLTAGPVASGTIPEPAEGGMLEWHNVDVDLRGLADPVLDANGTVVFRLSFDGGTPSSPGHHQMLDNVAISGTNAAEPKSLGLILAGSGSNRCML